MPLADNRELTSITTQAHQHMKRIVTALKKRGVPESNTSWLSELILSQPMPNGHTKPAPAAVEVREEEKR